MSELAWDYFLLVFLAGCGVIQIAASYSRLRGVLLLAHPWASALLGLVLVLGSFLWFFSPGPRHIPDTQGGLDGNLQAALFSLAALSAVVVTLLLSSLINRRLSHNPASWGLEALKETTYLKALAKGVRKQWAQRPRRTQRSSSGSIAG